MKKVNDKNLVALGRFIAQDLKTSPFRRARVTILPATQDAPTRDYTAEIEMAEMQRAIEDIASGAHGDDGFGVPQLIKPFDPNQVGGINRDDLMSLDMDGINAMSEWVKGTQSSNMAQLAVPIIAVGVSEMAIVTVGGVLTVALGGAIAVQAKPLADKLTEKLVQAVNGIKDKLIEQVDGAEEVDSDTDDNDPKKDDLDSDGGDGNSQGSDAGIMVIWDADGDGVPDNKQLMQNGDFTSGTAVMADMLGAAQVAQYISVSISFQSVRNGIALGITAQAPGFKRANTYLLKGAA